MMEYHDLPWTVSQLRSVAAGLRRLRLLLEERCEAGGPSRLQVSLGMQALEDTLETLTNRYPAFGGPPVSHALSALKTSISDVTNVPQKSETKRYSEIFRDFDNLELSLVYLTTEELLSASESQSPSETISSETTETPQQGNVSCEDTLSPEIYSQATEMNGNPSAQDADQALCRSEDGVETALQYAKMWCRYTKDLLGWMEKRITLEIGYWDVYDGSAIRELEGSQFGAINGMNITQDGSYFVTGGDDKLVKVWNYLDGEVTHVGLGHSGSITSVKICANNHTLVSTSADGAILLWRFPHPPSSS